MSKASTLAKLQTLLERVRARSSMPRNGQVGPAVAAATATEAVAAPAGASALQPASPATPSRVAAPSMPSASVARPAPPALLEDDGDDMPTVPPPAALEEIAVEEISVEIEVGEPESATTRPAAAAAPGGASGGAEPLPFESVAPPAPPQIAEGRSPAASESAERLVAADRVASEPPVAIVAGSKPAAPPEIEAAARPVVKVEHGVEPPPAPVEEAPEVPAAPASSRRPVAPEPEEHLAEMAFGSEEPAQPPRHTPPPESGRLPAAPVEEFDADVTGVRHAPHADVARAVEEERPLAAIEIRAAMPPSQAVGEIVGNPPPFEPATFAAWLEATLGL